MTRTNAADVKELFDTGLADATVTSWIEIATEIVDDIADADTTITSSRLTKIEKLLAAHLASAQDQRIKSTSRETASVTYQGETGSMDLRGTKYGQRAIMLDSSGVLSSLGKPTASVGVPDVKDV